MAVHAQTLRRPVYGFSEAEYRNGLCKPVYAFQGQVTTTISAI
jgi:hypothetical protein